MQLIPPTRTSTILARGNACAFLVSFLCVIVGLSSATKSPFAIVTMSMGSLIFGWLLVATVMAHLTSENDLVCALPELAAEFHAMSRFPVVVRVENPSNRWPLLFLTAELITATDGNVLRSPQKFLGMLPRRSAGEFEWTVTVRRRGAFQVHGLEAGTSFPGSLLVRRFFFAFDLPLLALPAVILLNSGVDQLLQGQRRTTGHQPSNPSAMEEFVGVREYRPGDNPRHVSPTLSRRMPDFPWQLVVREYSDPNDSEVTVVLDTVVPPDGAEDRLLMLYRHEKSISFAIALCRRLCELKHAVKFVGCQGDGKVIEIPIRHPSSDIPKLERTLARIEPIRTDEAVRRILVRQSQISDAVLLLISQNDSPTVRNMRSGAVLKVTPEWQASLVSQAVAP